MRARFALVLPVALLALAGCKSNCCGGEGCAACSVEEGASPAIFVNDTCPIGKEPVEADGGVAEYKGEKVGFCCPGCKAGWEEMSEADKDAFIAKAKAGEV